MSNIRYLVVSMLFVLLVIPLGVPSSTVLGQERPDVVANADITFASDRAKAVYEEVTQSSYETLVREFSEMGPKLYGTPGNEEARDWILERLQNLTDGRVVGQVRGDYENVVGRLPGSMGSSGPVVMIGAHYDTVEPAPGANDDGSGVATTLELARVLSKYNWPLDIYFGFWNAEESGLHGSNEMAQRFYRDEMDILIYYNIDMLLVVDPSLSVNEIINMFYASGNGADFHDAQYWAELTRVVGHNYGLEVSNPIPSSETRLWAYSDHASFERAGYRGVIFAHETGGRLDTAYHSRNDVWSNPLYNYQYATHATASIGASIAFALSREKDQVFHERHSIENLGTRSFCSVLLEMSTATELELTITTDTSVQIQVRIIDPLGQQVKSYEISTSGSLGSMSLDTGMEGTYEIVITNMASGLIDFEVDLAYETDIDGDNVPDSQQWWYNGFHYDADNDGIPDAEEEEIASDPHNSDQDNDSLSDYDEIYIYGTAHNKRDTDDDEIDDAYEILVGLDPLVKDSHKDPDFDGLSNLGEYLAGTDIYDSDSDSDLILDGWECAHGLDPLRDDAYEDSDGDTMENLYEYRAGYDPLLFDGPMLMVIPTVAIVFLICLTGIIWFGRNWSRKRTSNSK